MKIWKRIEKLKQVKALIAGASGDERDARELWYRGKS